MARFAALATLNVDDALPDAWVDEVKVAHDYLINAGADIASAASISISSEYHRVTGSTTITTITDAAGQVKGQQVWLQFVSAIQVGTTGNIQTLSGANSVYAAGDVGIFIWDGTSKWVEAVSGQMLDLNQTALQTLSGPITTGPTSAVPGVGGPGAFIAAPGANTSLYQTGNAGADVIRVALTTDTIARTVIGCGQILAGPGGAAALDTILNRTAAGIWLAQNKVFEVLPAAAVVSVPSTVTPDCAAGLVAKISVTAGGASTLTIAAPIHPPTSIQTAFLVVRISNTGGGTITLAWNAIYVAGPTQALPASIATGNKSMALFCWDGVNWQMMAAG